MQRRFTSKALAGAKVTRREGGSPIIEGYAAVFYRRGDSGTEYRLDKDIVERISPKAFERAVKEKHDARGLFNHDKNFILGRVEAGTLRLSVDERGLRYEIDVPDTTAGRDVVTSIERGDLSGSSFAFEPSARGVKWTEEGRTLVRNLEDLDVFDVGPVTMPAYTGTTTGLRNEDREALDRELEEWRREHPDDAEAVSVRLREIDLDEELQMHSDCV